MSSPMHKYLFSPPPSPPSSTSSHKARPPPLTSLKSLLLPNDLVPRNSLDGSEMKVRSPRTPQQRDFTLDGAYPSTLPTRGETVNLTLEDVEATPRSATTTPKRPASANKEKIIVSPPYLPANVPSAPIPMPSTLPRPLLRLLFLASLLVSSILLLVYVPAARLPSLRAASMSRRLALSPDGRAYLDVNSPVGSWEEAKERDYTPPQIKAAHMLRREIPAPILADIVANYPHPKRPTSRPLPSTHELLALQSYLLQSSYNVLPSSVDPQIPLDANIVLGYEADESALEELEHEREADVTVWYGGDGNTFPPNELLNLLSAIHGPHRKPTLFPVHGRADLSILLPLLSRLGISLDKYPVVMIGNKAVAANWDDIEEMRGNGELEAMLAKIGWVGEAGQEPKKDGWKPKLAKVAKKEADEVEQALNEVKRR